ncbi:MAG TPA: L,D-transpeptidase [Chthoniobacteraceae bacterium]|nr:L,D-transpeptidase [Chthoniobacteraceae bacterium]
MRASPFRGKDIAVRTAILRRLLLALPVLGFASCATKDTDHHVVVSVPDQRMVVYTKGRETARYPVSTSKFCLGDRPGSKGTPLGHLEIAKKIGDGAPIGMKFHGRRPTGEIVTINAPGRDPIVTRILWLKGLEEQNRNAYGRAIYIHGTAEEWRIGTPASFGCVRMRSSDVVHLFDTVGIGARVDITTAPLPPSPSEVPTDGERLAAARPAGG